MPVQLEMLWRTCNIVQAFESNITEIYNLLFAGRKLRIPFATKEEAETFRVKLYKYKQQQDMMLLAAEIVDSKQVLNFSLQATMQEIVGHPFEATIFFKDKDVTRKYTVQILEDTDDNEGTSTA